MTLSFRFSDEHRALQATLQTYATDRLLPGYAQRAAQPSIPPGIRRDLAQMGVLGIGLPADVGGSGDEDPIALGIAAETLAYGDMNVAALPVQTGLIGAQLSALRDPSLRERYLRGLIDGEVEVAIALTEPDSGSDASALRTTAVPVEGGGWRLSGTKASITQAMTAQAAIVYARAPQTTRSRGVSAFLVDLDLDGVTRIARQDMGMRPLARGDLSFQEVFVPESYLCGEQGAGFSQALGKFDFSRAAIGLMCLGAARRSLDEAAEFARQRKAFGRLIAEYQGISFPIAEHATYLEAARWLCYRALWLRAQHEPHTREAAMSKWWAPHVAKDAIEAAITTVGHGAYSEDLPLQARYRDVMGYLIADGTAEIQKLIIASQEIGPQVRGRP